MLGSLSVTEEVYARMNSDQANKILSAFDFDDPSGKYADPQSESSTNQNSMNEMMLKLFTAMDPKIFYNSKRLAGNKPCLFLYVLFICGLFLPVIRILFFI